MAETDIEAADVIRVILQFLKENQLNASLRALQEETSVVLNSVDNVESFVGDIRAGRWDLVLQTISQLRLPERKLMDLYEQITIELIEQREMTAARSMLRQTEPLQTMKIRMPDRYLHLEQLISRTFFDPNEAYPDGSSKEKRRAAIAEALSSEVGVVPPSRLMTLIHQALRWQQYQGMLAPGEPHDILRGTSARVAGQEDTFVTTHAYSVSFGKANAEAVRFSPDGHFLATGSIDGLVEMRSALTGKLRLDLAYQERDEYILMDSAVLSLAFSRDSELLACGSQSGAISVWNVNTGALIHTFSHAHAQGVTALCFSRDGTQLLSGSYDTTLRTHGLKTRKALKEFRGHTLYVNDVTFTADGNRILSASADGTVRVWDARSTECLAALRPRHAGAATGSAPTVVAVLPLPRNPDHVVVVDKSSELSLMTTRGQTLATLAVEEKEGVTRPMFVAGAVSFRGQYVYAAGEDNRIYAFNVESGAVDFAFQAHEKKEIVGVVAHPHLPLIVTYGTDGTLHAWKA